MKLIIFSAVLFLIIALSLFFYFRGEIQIILLNFLTSFYRKEVKPPIKQSPPANTFFPQGFHGPSGTPFIRGPGAPPPNY